MSSFLSAGMAEVAAMSESAFRKRFQSSYESSPSVSPPDLPSRKRYHGTSELVENSEVDDDEGYGLDDESRGIDDESHSVESDGFGLEEEEEVYGALRRHELALKEGDVYSTFEVGQGSGSAPESERPERTPPSPEWTSGSLPISLLPSDNPSPISSPMIPLTVPSLVATPAADETEGFLTKLGAQVQKQEGLISDHAVQLEELSPALFEMYNRDIGELFTRAIWRPVLALDAWAGQTDAQRAALWHAISDVQGENRDLRLQLAEERHAQLELAKVVD
ncbi:hypothetical protein Tco_0022240, partial [Tanacetum coccineum]